MKYHPEFFQDFEALRPQDKARVLEALSAIRADPFVGKTQEHVTVHKYQMYDMSDTLNVRVESDSYDTHLRIFYQIKEGSVFIVAVGKRKHYEAYYKAAQRLNRVGKRRR